MNVRTLLFATALVAASFLSPSAAEEIGSAIDAVTVYSRGAEVTRVARISLQAGANILADSTPKCNTCQGGDSSPLLERSIASGGVRAVLFGVRALPEQRSPNGERRRPGPVFATAASPLSRQPVTRTQ